MLRRIIDFVRRLGRNSTSSVQMLGKAVARINAMEDQLRLVEEKLAAVQTIDLSALQAQVHALASACELMDAHMAYLRQPNDLRVVQNAVNVLVRQNKPVPEDLEEHLLRLLLRDDPYNIELSRLLIAFFARTKRPLCPDLPIEPKAGPQDVSGLDDLLRSADEYAHAGDTFRVFAVMWQVCVRYPQTPRGWAEFARCLADRREWSSCRIAAERALAAGPPDEATATAMLSALSTLAENGELASLDWEAWIEQATPRLQVHPHVVNILRCTSQAGRAATLLPRTLEQWPDSVETWIAASSAAGDTERLQEAYDHIWRAFQLDPAAAVRVVTGASSGYFATVIDRLGKSDELADWISDRAARWEGLNLAPPSPAPEARRALQNSRQMAIDRGLPSAFLVTLPKSASVTVGNIFAAGFGLPTVLYSLVNLRVVSPWLHDYLKGGASYVTHLRATPRNIDLLVAGGTPGVIVHVRDLRQGVVAIAGHLRQYAHLVLPSVREQSLGGPAEAIAFVIREVLPRRIEWIDEWIKARARLTVNFTTFEDFVRDRDRFLDRVLSSYGGDTRFFDRKRAFEERAGVDYHRRAGLIDEWKSVLTRPQIEEVNALIPHEYWNLFGWEP